LGFYLDSTGRCSALPSNMVGCHTPFGDFQSCKWCNGYFGYYESNVTSTGVKTCTPGGVNFYQKARQTGYINNAAIYKFAFAGLLVAIFQNFF
jgi:hypothetical protein